MKEFIKKLLRESLSENINAKNVEITIERDSDGRFIDLENKNVAFEQLKNMFPNNAEYIINELVNSLDQSHLYISEEQLLEDLAGILSGKEIKLSSFADSVDIKVGDVEYNVYIKTHPYNDNLTAIISKI